MGAGGGRRDSRSFALSLSSFPALLQAAFSPVATECYRQTHLFINQLCVLFHLVGVPCWAFEGVINFWSGLCSQLEKNVAKIGENAKFQNVMHLVYQIGLEIQNFQTILVQRTVS